ncbi:hypothetical protein CAPTEDRAFT_165162 [Capitella teleta]|uniref:Complexin n=1 Tax=Capitella teleta TaxID=283909 RepID=R7TIX3_CAPTE|nr:hypothetical protein CAPTEDRAFT_165162 [Capitella teleta]|eukprot:ELT93427.1 hypothetical protein CAPTEDRAFT_165162 [Capitella teleta]
MAAFVAKQMVGSKLKSVKGALGDKEEKAEGEGGKAEEQEEDPEIAEARREAEEKRKEKHRKMEEEREEMRQSIRDKYGLKKKVIAEPEEDPDMEGRLGRKRKTPAEMAAEANADSDDELQNSVFPKDLNELQSKVQEIPGKVMTSVSEATEKCVLQ